jgi:hypothetical protein
MPNVRNSTTAAAVPAASRTKIQGLGVEYRSGLRRWPQEVADVTCQCGARRVLSNHIGCVSQSSDLKPQAEERSRRTVFQARRQLLVNDRIAHLTT